MGLNIKSARTEAAVRELAALTGESLTSAVDTAVREKLRSLHAGGGPPPASENLKALQQIFARDPRTRAEIDAELYDDAGLPR